MSFAKVATEAHGAHRFKTRVLGADGNDALKQSWAAQARTLETRISSIDNKLNRMQRSKELSVGSSLKLGESHLDSVEMLNEARKRAITLQRDLEEMVRKEIEAELLGLFLQEVEVIKNTEFQCSSHLTRQKLLAQAKHKFRKRVQVELEKRKLEDLSLAELTKYEFQKMKSSESVSPPTQGGVDQFPSPFITQKAAIGINSPPRRSSSFREK
jgi:hypothetical protein